MIRWAALFALLAAPLAAEELRATGATLRVLDRLSDKVQDLHLAPGGAGTFGRLTITMDECRYPAGEPGESIAHLTIRDSEVVDPVFSGWMLAASPALNALDHPRYDAWLLQCDAPEAQDPAQDSASGG